MTETGIVQIRNKSYKTVALRVSEFREQCPAKDGWAIVTELVERNDEFVVILATILNNGTVVATGLAEEKRSSSQINKTSAVENCETSAIGRALAAFGLGGSEYASANEVANAIHQQQKPTLSNGDQTTVDRRTSEIAAAPTETALRLIGESLRSESHDVQNAIRPVYAERLRALQRRQEPQPAKTAEVF